MAKRVKHNKLSAAQIGRLEKVRSEARNVAYAIDSILVVGYGENVKESEHAVSHRTWLETVLGRLLAYSSDLADAEDISEENTEKSATETYSKIKEKA